MFARGVTKWFVVAFIPSIVALPFLPLLALTLMFLPLGVILFFRDPDREPLGDGVLSPADGRVTQVDGGERVRVSVFMRPYDVHVNRSPIDGSVVEMGHVPGKHLPAFSKSSDRNERVKIMIDSLDGEFVLVQVAGTLARRITPYVDVGDELSRGERVGVIAFGSRADVVFPPQYTEDDVLVGVGDTVRAGETVIARKE